MRLTFPDSIVSRCESGRKAVTRAAYLLFYRRRSPVPLGPPELQKVVTADVSNPDSDDENNTDADDQQTRSRSPAGNGLRLGDSSRNGSSSAGAVGAGAAVLRGDGYQRSAAGSRPKSGAAAVNLSDEDDEDLPPYADEDEGYAEDSYSTNPWTAGDSDRPMWSFNALSENTIRNDNDSDTGGVASDTGAASTGDSMELSNRLLEDFGDEEPIKGRWDGVGTPVLQQEDEVAEIRLAGE